MKGQISSCMAVCWLRLFPTPLLVTICSCSLTLVLSFYFVLPHATVFLQWFIFCIKKKKNLIWNREWTHLTLARKIISRLRTVVAPLIFIYLLISDRKFISTDQYLTFLSIAEKRILQICKSASCCRILWGQNSLEGCVSSRERPRSKSHVSGYFKTRERAHSEEKFKKEREIFRDQLSLWE